MATITAAPIPGAAAITVAGQSVLLLPHRAAFWPAMRTVIIADLHLDKCELMRAHGLPIPRALLEEQVHRLGAAIQVTGAQRVLVVGDLLHAPAGLTGPMVECFAAWRAATPIEVAIIPGNHDRALLRIAEVWRLTILDPIHAEGPFAFIHDPAQAPRLPQYVWAGHVHPAITLQRGGDFIKLACFLVGERRAILPAFSTFTAGGSTGRCRPDRIFGIADGTVLEL